MRILVTFLFLCALALPALAQNVGIGTATPHASALLDLESTDKGLLIPRLTQAQIDAMGTLPAGLLLYNTTTQCFQYHNGTSWVRQCADKPVPCPPLP